MGAATVGLCSTSDETITEAEKDLPKNLCPLIKSSYGFAKTDKCPYFYFSDLIVGETTCDGKKKMYEYLGQFKNVHVMNLPNTQSEDSLVLWKKEIIRLKEALEAQFGVTITEDDIRAVTSLSRQAGQIKAYEEAYIRNILALDQKRVYDIMTPRTVVFSLPEDMTAAEAYKNPRLWHVSRIPVYGEDNEDLVGLVDRRTILHCLLEEKGETPLSAIMKPLHFVLESQTLDKLLKELLHSRSHLFAVLDEYGGLAGVVTLEDVFEEMLGSEIMDESDSVADLRQMARQRRQALRAAGLLEQQKKEKQAGQPRS